jgi:uncharacterized protein YbbC (DUF1343 family)
MAIIMTIIPMAMAAMAILIIGALTLFLYAVLLCTRCAMKYSKFNPYFSMFKYTILLMALTLNSCDASINQKNKTSRETRPAPVSQQEDFSSSALVQPMENGPTPAADRVSVYLPQLQGKSIAIVGNQTSVVNSLTVAQRKSWDDQAQIRFVHLVDTLHALDIDVQKVFAPEHGFRGTADAGAVVQDGIDMKTGIPIISLYGKNKKPTAAQLQGIDMVVFDIQDVGARFYTYISTLHYVMEAAAENDIPIMILDRPNPNGYYIDGPILEPAHKSFVGMHPVPVVHGMTVGEYAQMINGEQWLEYGAQADLTIIKAGNYKHEMVYDLPIPPSPNLPNAQAINLYPSLCFFEGTDVSVGRGTDMQFQIYGSPSLARYREFSFTPTPNPGAKRPKFNGKRCFGVDLREHPKLMRLQLDFLVDAFAKAPYKQNFFNSFFTKLAGTELLQEQIEKGTSAADIAATWENGLEDFKKTREKYLLYN